MTRTQAPQLIRAAMRRLGLVAGCWLILALAPLSTATDQVTCFTVLLPRGLARECFALPSGDQDFEMTPRAAANYCARWAATGTVLPCPYSTIAADGTGDGSASAPVETEDRGNRWRRLRN
jgi:hypothetical protein